VENGSTGRDHAVSQPPGLLAHFADTFEWRGSIGVGRRSLQSSSRFASRHEAADALLAADQHALRTIGFARLQGGNGSKLCVTFIRVEDNFGLPFFFSRFSSFKGNAGGS